MSSPENAPAPIGDAVLGLDPSVGLVSVVIPAWDEAETMEELVRGIRAVLEPRAREIEIIVVVPSPDDSTVGAARDAGATVLAQLRPGYGGALKGGLLAARGDFVVTMDKRG